MVIPHPEISCACLLVMSALAGTTGSPVVSSEPVGYSSLVAFPRVGRSAPQDQENGYYYGQKREGKSGLIPFPRVGRAGKQTWLLQPRNPPVPDKKTNSDTELSRPKRQTLIPFPRVGKRDGAGSQAASSRSTRGHMLRLGKRRMLRLGKRGSAVLEARPSKRGSPVLRMGKRQTLIPFPRTGKRSAGFVPQDHSNAELNQFYVYDEQKEAASRNDEEEAFNQRDIDNGGEVFSNDDIVSLGESSSLLPGFHMNAYRDSSTGLVDMGDYDLYRYDDST